MKIVKQISENGKKNGLKINKNWCGEVRPHEKRSNLMFEHLSWCPNFLCLNNIKPFELIDVDTIR